MSNFAVPILILFLSTGSAVAAPYSAELEKLLPARIGAFRRSTTVRPLRALLTAGSVNFQLVESAESRDSGVSSVEVEYRAENGKRVLIELVQFRSDSDAYSLFTIIRRAMSEVEDLVLDTQVGTASASSNDRIVFFKGATLGRISGDDSTSSREALELARLVADKLDRGDGEIPVLVMHLPDWQNAQKRVLYFSRFKSLQPVVSGQPVLALLDTVADTDAVVADYGQARLILVEFNTPQLAGDIDRQVIAKLQELRSQNQPTPTSYRRVGNYAVFVLNAVSEQAAIELINQIQYEQVVQWLGDNPYWLKEAQRRYTETTLGVLVAVVKASGLTLVGCFGLGGLIGAILFVRRRARQASTAAFSDAGGMLRLNLDDNTQQTDPARLLPDRN